MGLTDFMASQNLTILTIDLKSDRFTMPSQVGYSQESWDMNFSQPNEWRWKHDPLHKLLNPVLELEKQEWYHGGFRWLSTSAWVTAGDGGCQEGALFGSCLSHVELSGDAVWHPHSPRQHHFPFNLPPPSIRLACLWHALPAPCHQLLGPLTSS